MAIETDIDFSGPYLTNGLTTVFPFSFVAPSTEEIAVVLYDADGVESVATGYSATLLPDGGGSIAFAAAPVAGYQLFIALDPVFTQSVTFENGSAWLAEPVNEVADRSALRDIWLRGRVARSLQVPFGDTPPSVEIGDLIDGDLLTFREGKLKRLERESFAGMFYAGDATGKPVPASGTGADGALRADLAQDSGGALLGEEDGGSMQDAVNLLKSGKANILLGQITGLSGNAPNIRQFAHNFQHSNDAASAVMGGTADQPNINGGKNFVQNFQGDGVTASFAVTPGFVVANAPYRNILLYQVTRATRAEAIWNEATHYTVADKGTGTITITPNSTLAATDDLFVRVYDKSNSSALSMLLNGILFGYDNSNDGSGPMTVLIGAHHIVNDCTGGHNIAVGGSNNKFLNGTSYSAAFGLSQTFDAALAGTLGGMRNKGTGTAPTAFGASNDAGAWSLAVGELCNANAFYSTALGRRAKAMIAGSLTLGAGAASDAESGMMGPHFYLLRRNLTTATATTLIPVTGNSWFQMPENSKAFVEADVFMSEIGTDNFRLIRLVAALRRQAGSTVSFIANSTYADQATIIEENGVVAAGAEWQAQIFTSASGGFVISARGKAGLTIQTLSFPQVLLIADGAFAL